MNYLKNKTMKKVLIALFVISSQWAIAQNHYFGTKAGINFSTVYLENIQYISITSVDYLGSYTGGITYNYIFSSNITIGAEVLYRQSGYTSLINENRILLKFKDENISIPLKFGYQMGEKIIAFGNLGIVSSFLISSKNYSLNNDDEMTLRRGYDNTDEKTRYSLGGMAELGGGYSFKNDFLIYLSLGFHHDIIPTYEPIVLDKNYYYGFAVSLGFRMAI